MKVIKTILIITILLSCSSSYAQSDRKEGIYRTFSDFEANKKENVGSLKTYGTGLPWELASVTFESNGVLTEYTNEDCWGFVDQFGNLFRFKNALICKVLIIGEVTVYGSMFSGHNSDGGLTGEWFKVSKGTNGEIINYKNFDNLLEEYYPQIYTEYKADRRFKSKKFLYYVDKCNEGKGIRK